MKQIEHYFPNLTEIQKKQFDQLGNLYQHWNEQINVISRKDTENFYERHVLHSLGIAKVIGGRFNVLATDIFKQVIGQQNFEMGAVVGFVLLIPAVVAFAADRILQGRQVALLSARAVPLVPKPAP